MAVAVPHPREEQRDVVAMQFEGIVGDSFRIRIAAPQSLLLRPRHGPTFALPIDPTHAHAEATAIALDDCDGVRETLDRVHEVIAVKSIGRVEVERVWVTQVAFAD